MLLEKFSKHPSSPGESNSQSPSKQPPGSPSSNGGDKQTNLNGSFLD